MPFSVEEFHDLVRLLEERPEWRSSLRRLVLTDELLALPAQVAEFRIHAEQRFQELAAAQARTETQVAALATEVTGLATVQARTETQVAALATEVTGLAAAQARTETQVAALATEVTGLATVQARTETHVTTLTERVTTLTAQVGELTQAVRLLTDDVGNLKGKNLEAEYRTKAFAYFGSVLRRARALTSDEFMTLVEDAVDSGALSAAEARDLALADVVVRGRRPEDGSEVYLVVEVSWGVGPHDVERAARRAALLAQAGVVTIPVVAGKQVTAEAIELARRQQVWQVVDGHSLRPEP
jgi:polyhydroxyalkanoate synthesis regulator phasin